MDRADGSGRITVQVVYSPRAGEVDECTVELVDGARLVDALRASGFLERYPVIDVPTQTTGIWGRRRPHDALLRDGDRVEAYRPLLLDPMQARRLRQQRQRASGNPPK